MKSVTNSCAHVLPLELLKPFLLVARNVSMNSVVVNLLYLSILSLVGYLLAKDGFLDDLTHNCVVISNVFFAISLLMFQVAARSNADIPSRLLELSALIL